MSVGGLIFVGVERSSICELYQATDGPCVSEAHSTERNIKVVLFGDIFYTKKIVNVHEFFKGGMSNE